MRESDSRDLRDVDRAHFSVTLDAQNGRHRGEMTLYGAGQPILYAQLGPAVWDYVFHDPNIWHERDDLMRLIASFELEVLGLELTGHADEEKFTPADGGGPMLYRSTVQRVW
jgi:hypothetical protein